MFKSNYLKANVRIITMKKQYSQNMQSTNVLKSVGTRELFVDIL